MEDAELLAVILRTGTRNVNSVELARRVLARSNGSLAGLYEQSVPDFRKIPGIGRVKAVQLECLKELSARVVKSVSPAKTDFTSAEEIFHRYSGEMRRERQEVVKVLFLNGQCRLIREYEASRGSVNASLVPVREILVEAVKSEAVYFILMHNHPSGDPMPSHEDRTVTERLKEAGKLVGIELLDHLIFGSARYVSMRQRGWIT